MIHNCPAGRSLQEGLRVKEELAQANHTVLCGRQILFRIYEFFQNTLMALVHSVTDLTKHQYPGGARVREFRHRWGLIAGSMPDTLGDPTLATIDLASDA